MSRRQVVTVAAVISPKTRTALRQAASLRDPRSQQPLRRLPLLAAAHGSLGPTWPLWTRQLHESIDTACVVMVISPSFVHAKSLERRNGINYISFILQWPGSSCSGGHLEETSISPHLCRSPQSMFRLFGPFFFFSMACWG